MSYVPVKIREKIESLDLSRRLKDRAYRMVILIMVNTLKADRELDEFVEIPSTYWKKIDPNYQRVLFKLEEVGIIKRTVTYSTWDNKCKLTMINPELLSGEFTKVEYEAPKRKNNNDFLLKATRRVLRSLKLDKRAALGFMKSYVDEEWFARHIRYDGEVIARGSVKIKYRIGQGKYHEFFTPVDHAITTAKKTGKSLIQDKQKIIVDYPDNYIQLRSWGIESVYREVINRIADRNFYADRNDTNYRLDHNLTTLPSCLLPFITLRGQSLVGLDLKNSQFVFLAKLIEEGFFDQYLPQPGQKKLQNWPFCPPKQCYKVGNRIKVGINESNDRENVRSDDIYVRHLGIERSRNEVINGRLSSDLLLFINLAKSGQIYEYIQVKLALPVGSYGRSLAKGIMFQIFFAGHQNRRAEKGLVKNLFPNLMGMIDAYKKDKGDNQFAISLQLKESEVFIDKILRTLYSKGFEVLSKHDSILCVEDDQEAVRKVMVEILDMEFGVGGYQLSRECLNEYKQAV